MRWCAQVPAAWVSGMTSLKFLDLANNSALCGTLPSFLELVRDFLCALFFAR